MIDTGENDKVEKTEWPDFDDIIRDMARDDLCGRCTRYIWTWRIMLEDYDDKYTDNVRDIVEKMNTIMPLVGKLWAKLRNTNPYIFNDDGDGYMHLVNIKAYNEASKEYDDLWKQQKDLYRRFDYIFEKRSILEKFKNGTLDIRRERDRLSVIEAWKREQYEAEHKDDSGDVNDEML
jgi:hypothetical protein